MMQVILYNHNKIKIPSKTRVNRCEPYKLCYEMMNTFNTIFRTRIRRKFQFGTSDIKLSNTKREGEKERYTETERTHISFLRRLLR